MLDYKLRDNEFKSGLLSAIAVLGLDIDNGSWMPAKNFTPLLLVVVTLARAMVVYKAHLVRVKSIIDLVSEGHD